MINYTYLESFASSDENYVRSCLASFFAKARVKKVISMDYLHALSTSEFAGRVKNIGPEAFITLFDSEANSTRSENTISVYTKTKLLKAFKTHSIPSSSATGYL